MMTVLVSFLSEIKGEGACAQGESFVVFVILSTFLRSPQKIHVKRNSYILVIYSSFQK